MPKAINHELRRKVILRRAFKLFAQKGYRNTNLSDLAITCNISRPSLYLYFRDKEEIFTYAIKYYTDEMFLDYKDEAELSGPVLVHIRKIVGNIVFKSWLNRDFIASLGDYLVQKRHEGKNFPEIIRRRTLKLDHLFRRMLREGVERGELRSIQVGATAMQILDLIQAYLFKLAIIRAADPRQTISVIEVFLGSLAL
ncbi:hypothetical protein S1OALGB6SA_463 [Olavius algarvensis spirochete endosymbiont]|uniref:TetR/AcrR family transcriptional regulator n=1 Tax=Olavius algarvensis spirochete endosymbiont TaxID=260710 RepID=UPI00068B7C33|nr:TetR/AcrR family transcriptional regulator [Olavius algarvensis spirochete endosymbiont]CAD7836984.1 MAG: hypothetical protein [Olavius algarvensis spirochete endosymbiont]VDA99395.1 hypothetical protein S1OALGB6SA_463 [Olavius algarvensis spirochete endosymbiont]